MTQTKTTQNSLNPWLDKLAMSVHPEPVEGCASAVSRREDNLSVDHLLS